MQRPPTSAPKGHHVRKAEVKQMGALQQNIQQGLTSKRQRNKQNLSAAGSQVSTLAISQQVNVCVLFPSSWQHLAGKVRLCDDRSRKRPRVFLFLLPSCPFKSHLFKSSLPFGVLSQTSLRAAPPIKKKKKEKD